MTDEETSAACAWCCSPEVDQLVMCGPSTLGQGPVQHALLCAPCATAAARFLFDAAWRKRIDGAVMLAFAHGYRLEQEVSPC